MPRLTEKEFRCSTHREALMVLLEGDVLRNALEIIEGTLGVPRAVPLAVNGQHHTDAVLSRILSETVGVNKTLNKLRELAQPLPKEGSSSIDDDPNRPAGYDYLPEPLKAWMREQYESSKKQATP